MHDKLLIRQFPMHIQKTSHVTVTWLLHCSKSFYLLYLLKLYRNCSASYLKSWMIKMIRKEKKNHQNSELLSFYTHREIVYTCLNKLGIETCWDTIRLHGGYSNGWNLLTKMNQSFWCSLLHLFLNSYNFLFQIQSSSSADSPAKSRPWG